MLFTRACSAVIVAAALFGGAAFPSAALAQPAALPAANDPTVSWVCPMHAEVIDDKGGICPICKMALVAVRLESVWTCPVHAVVAAAGPGTCPIDHTRELVQVTVAVSWTCRNHPETDVLEQGTCADGSAMVRRRTLRPHGNHNPQHGGLFFMAPDNWHHVEGVHPRPGVFRVYVYDEFAKPIPANQMRAVQGRLVLKETFDPETKQTRELSVFPLALSRDGRYLEATVGAAPTAAEMTAKIQFKAGGREGRFDFVFSGLSKEPR